MAVVCVAVVCVAFFCVKDVRAYNYVSHALTSLALRRLALQINRARAQLITLRARVDRLSKLGSIQCTAPTHFCKRAKDDSANCVSPFAVTPLRVPGLE